MKQLLFTAAAVGIVASASATHAQSSDADLVVSVVAASATQALPDQQIAVDCDVLNQGSGAAGQSRLKYYFSSDAVLDASDTYLNYDNVAALGAGTTGSESANVRIPEDAPDGSYFILFVADYDQEVGESDESNNVFALPVTVGSPVSGPDVAVDLASLSVSQADPDEQLVASADVVNLGSAGTGVETRLKYYLSTDETYDAGDTYLNYDAVPALAAQGASAETANVRVPADTAPGMYYVLFVADETELLAETDEGNNVAALPLVVGDVAAEPDLRVSGTSVTTPLPDGVVRAGQAVDVTAVVVNDGVVAAPTVDMKYVLSTDAVYDASDKQLSYDQIDSLGAGLEGHEEASLNISTATAAGDFVAPPSQRR